MTAVEWLEEELKANLKKVILEGDFELMESLFEQAKQMEKEQMIEFSCQVAESSAMKYIQGKTTRMIAEELLTA